MQTCHGVCLYGYVCVFARSKSCVHEAQRVLHSLGYIAFQNSMATQCPIAGHYVGMVDQRKGKRLRLLISLKESDAYKACRSPPPLPDPSELLSMSKRQWEATMRIFRRQLASSRMAENVGEPIGMSIGSESGVAANGNDENLDGADSSESSAANDDTDHNPNTADICESTVADDSCESAVANERKDEIEKDDCDIPADDDGDHEYAMPAAVWATSLPGYGCSVPLAFMFRPPKDAKEQMLLFLRKRRAAKAIAVAAFRQKKTIQANNWSSKESQTKWVIKMRVARRLHQYCKVNGIPTDCKLPSGVIGSFAAENIEPEAHHQKKATRQQIGRWYRQWKTHASNVTSFSMSNWLRTGTCNTS